MILWHDLVRILRDDGVVLVIHAPATQLRGYSITLICVGILLGLVFPFCSIVGPIWTDDLEDALVCGMLGMLFVSIGGIGLRFASDSDFQFRSEERDLLVCQSGKERSISLNRIQKAAVVEDGEGGFLLKLKLRGPGNQMVMAWSIQEGSNSQLRLLQLEKRINQFLEVFRRKGASGEPSAEISN